MTDTITIHGHEYHLTTDHSASSYGMPVLVDETGASYGPEDSLPGPENDPVEFIYEPASLTVCVAVGREEKLGLMDAAVARTFRRWAAGR